MSLDVVNLCVQRRAADAAASGFPLRLPHSNEHNRDARSYAIVPISFNYGIGGPEKCFHVALDWAWLLKTPSIC